MASMTLTVTGMTCGHCRAKVEQALQGVNGVYAATVDLPGGSAEVDFDEKSVNADALIAAVTRAGYRAAVAAQ